MSQQPADQKTATSSRIVLKLGGAPQPAQQPPASQPAPQQPSSAQQQTVPSQTQPVSLQTKPPAMPAPNLIQIQQGPDQSLQQSASVNPPAQNSIIKLGGGAPKVTVIANAPPKVAIQTKIEEKKTAPAPLSMISIASAPPSDPSQHAKSAVMTTTTTQISITGGQTQIAAPNMIRLPITQQKPPAQVSPRSKKEPSADAKAATTTITVASKSTPPKQTNAPSFPPSKLVVTATAAPAQKSNIVVTSAQAAPKLNILAGATSKPSRESVPEAKLTQPCFVKIGVGSDMAAKESSSAKEVVKMAETQSKPAEPVKEQTQGCQVTLRLGGAIGGSPGNQAPVANQETAILKPVTLQAPLAQTVQEQKPGASPSQHVVIQPKLQPNGQNTTNSSISIAASSKASKPNISSQGGLIQITAAAPGSSPSSSTQVHLQQQQPHPKQSSQQPQQPTHQQQQQQLETVVLSRSEQAKTSQQPTQQADVASISQTGTSSKITFKWGGNSKAQPPVAVQQQSAMAASSQPPGSMTAPVTSSGAVKIKLPKPTEPAMQPALEPVTKPPQPPLTTSGTIIQLKQSQTAQVQMQQPASQQQQQQLGAATSSVLMTQNEQTAEQQSQHAASVHELSYQQPSALQPSSKISINQHQQQQQLTTMDVEMHAHSEPPSQPLVTLQHQSVPTASVAEVKAVDQPSSTPITIKIGTSKPPQSKSVQPQQLSQQPKLTTQLQRPYETTQQEPLSAGIQSMEGIVQVASANATYTQEMAAQPVIDASQWHQPPAMPDNQMAPVISFQQPTAPQVPIVQSTPEQPMQVIMQQQAHQLTVPPQPHQAQPLPQQQPIQQHAQQSVMVAPVPAQYQQHAPTTVPLMQHAQVPASYQHQPQHQPQQPQVSAALTGLVEPIPATTKIESHAQQPQLAAGTQLHRHAKTQPKRLNLLDFYYVRKRSLAFELQPDTKSYRGQIKLELGLKMMPENPKNPTTEATKPVSLLENVIEQSKAQGSSRVLLEASLLAKQVKVVEVCLLSKDAQTGEFKKESAQKFADGNLAEPVNQAKVNPELYKNLSRHLYQLEDVQKSQNRKYLTQGTIQLKLSKKMFQFKNADKVKKELFIMIDYLCDHIADIGGVKCVKYRKELADQLAMTASSSPVQHSSEFFYTSDEPNQSIAWLPQLVGSHKMASPWHLQFLVPKDYTVIASGKLVERSVEDETALYEYEVTEADRAIPDRIGFLVCQNLLTTPFDVQGKKDLGVANFLSRQKQANFNPKIASDTVDFICSLMSFKHYPCKDTKICFLPNLFPSGFPKQSQCFAGGLYLLDQELLYKPNQLDKRHKLYKHLATSLTFAFFGGKVREAEWSDNWLLVAIRERIGDRFTKSKCGNLLYKYHIMKRIEKLYKLMKEGIETHPLQRTKLRDPESCSDLRGLGCPDPSDQIANDIFYRKCGLVMQMIELKIGELLDTIFKEMYQDALQSNERVIQLESFRATYKKVCGIRASEIFNNWIFSTSCPKLTLEYEFNKRYNSLDLTLKQESAAASSMRVHKNVQSKVDRIFGMSGPDLERELLGEPEPNETFNVDMKQQCKRWFTGSVNVVICQADGGGGEILKQQHKMTLKNYKSTVSAHITLLGRVRRTQNRKKDLDYLPQAALQQNQEAHHQQAVARRLGPGGRPMHGPHGPRGRGASDFGVSDAATSQAAQMMLNQDVQKFEMNEFELEDFPPETKNIFRKELDNNPVLWIRVDPGMEYIRKVKVVQKKRNNWLFQLLREQDIVGQIEAVRQLHKYNEDLVYEILKTVSRNENYFFKVRKEVLKTMHKMEISVINEHLSHEAFLLKCFNQKNFDKVTGFYRENNFTNLLQYYLDRSVIKYISMSKEEKLNLTESSKSRLNELQMKQSKLTNESNMEDAVSADGKTPQKERSVDPNAPDSAQQAPSTMIKFNIAGNQFQGLEAKGGKSSKSKGKIRNSALSRQHMQAMSDFRITTDKVAEMLLKVLEQNDNSENYFDDSFLIRDILASLGRLDNINYISRIASAIYNQFKLDQISNSSPMFSVTTGAIKGHFNLRKQIYRFVNHKRQHIEPSDPFYQNRVKKHGNEQGPLNNAHNNLAVHNSMQSKPGSDMLRVNSKDQIEETESTLDLMKDEIDGLLADPLTPLQLRLFIFDEEIKNIIFYKSLPLVKALQVIIDAIFNLQAKMEIRFATYCLRELVMFLESVKFVHRINFTELFVESEQTKHLMDTVWSFICLPHSFLSSEMTYWAKRFINRVYGRILPKFLMNCADLTHDPDIYQTDETWAKTEASLAAEEQERTRLAELQKQEQKNKHLMAAHQFQATVQQAGTDSAMAGMNSAAGINSSILTQRAANQRQGAGGEQSMSQITLNNSKIGIGSKKTLTTQASGNSDKALISIPNRANPIVSTNTGEIKIKATNNTAASTNDHILNVKSGTISGKISIPNISSSGTAIRLTAISGLTSAAIESKIQAELRDASRPLPLQQDPSSSTAVVHLGPQTNTAIKLPGSIGQVGADASSSQSKPSTQVIVIRGGQQSLNKSAQDGANSDDEAGASQDKSQTKQHRKGANLITTGVLSGENQLEGQGGDKVMLDANYAAGSSDDEGENSHSTVRIVINDKSQGLSRVERDEEDDDDDDIMMSDEDNVVQQRIKEQQQNNRLDVEMMDSEEDLDEEDEYGQPVRRRRDSDEMDELDIDRQDREDGEDDDDESVYDPFAAEKMDDPEMQKCWLILGKIYYHYEVTDFLDPVTPETFGDEKLYEEYCSVVSEPMDISTIMAKMRAGEYENKYQFKRDMMLIFDNCREFNEAGTEIVNCANSLTIEFSGLWQEYDMS